MAYEAKNNSGVLFSNKKTSDKQPDYTGNFKDENGKTWRLAAWIKEGQKGKFLSLLASEQQEKQSSNNSTTDDLPF